MGDISNYFVMSIDNQLTVAHKLLNSIKNKFRKNKLVMWGTIGFLILVLIIVLYSYLGGTGGTSTTIIQQQPSSNSGTDT